MVVDGGAKESGQKIVDHIKEHYGTTHVHYLVNTPPDADYAAGLEVVLEQLTFGEAPAATQTAPPMARQTALFGWPLHLA